MRLMSHQGLAREKIGIERNSHGVQQRGQNVHMRGIPRDFGWWKDFRLIENNRGLESLVERPERVRPVALVLSESLPVIAHKHKDGLLQQMLFLKLDENPLQLLVQHSQVFVVPMASLRADGLERILRSVIRVGDMRNKGPINREEGSGRRLQLPEEKRHRINLVARQRVAVGMFAARD